MSGGGMGGGYGGGYGQQWGRPATGGRTPINSFQPQYQRPETGGMTPRDTFQSPGINPMQGQMNSFTNQGPGPVGAQGMDRETGFWNPTPRDTFQSPQTWRGAAAPNPFLHEDFATGGGFPTGGMTPRDSFAPQPPQNNQALMLANSNNVAGFGMQKPNPYQGGGFVPPWFQPYNGAR